jgi:hypothetical protein
MRCSHCLHTGTRWLLVAATRERCPACTVAAASVGPNHPALAAAAAWLRRRLRRRRSLTLHEGGARSQDQQQCCVGQHTAQHGCWKLQVGLRGWWGWGACLGHPWITAKVASLTAARTLHSLAALYRQPRACARQGSCRHMRAQHAPRLRAASVRLPSAISAVHCSLACAFSLFTARARNTEVNAIRQ